VVRPKALVSKRVVAMKFATFLWKNPIEM